LDCLGARRFFAAARSGFDCRLAVDWTDHVWTEVRLDGKWVHCDSCEGSMDAPLTYEAGWGKKLSYVVAFSPQEVIDVTARYIVDWSLTLTRRTQVSEECMAELVSAADGRARQLPGSADAAPPPPWRSAEEAELGARRRNGGVDSHRAGGLSPEELCGRLSGSAEWRSERGELGRTIPLRTSTSPRSVSLGGTSAGGSAEAAIGTLLGGAALEEADGLARIDLTADCAAVEIAGAAGAPLEDALLSSDGFTVEVWYRADLGRLHRDAFQNPLVSRHGAGSGWELRLTRSGGVVFLVTAVGQHHELEGNALSTAPAAEAVVPALEEGEGGSWAFVAATFRDGTARLFMGPGSEPAAELKLPSGLGLDSFPGPLLLGRNPAWRDRGARCHIAAFRLSWTALEPAGFLPPPEVATFEVAMAIPIAVAS